MNGLLSFNRDLIMQAPIAETVGLYFFRVTQGRRVWFLILLVSPSGYPVDLFHLLPQPRHDHLPR